MSANKAYIVIRCPNCGFYSLASPGQKTRLCVRCGKTAKLGDSYARRAENFKEAQKLMGELNRKRESETICETSGLQTMPYKSDPILDQAKTSNRGLLRTFREVLLRYADKEAEMTEFLEECEQHGIPREYAQKLIRELENSGQAYRPEKDKIRFI
ncbi:MAG: DUF1922 domain-containing protein [Promethearchaeati archaeon SRVP18_Atabeyarchaeia-1]